MDIKKEITIGIIVISIAASGIFFVYRSLQSDKVFAQAVSSTPSSTISFPPSVPSSTLPDYLGSVSEVFGTFPSGSTLNIGTPTGVVTINNIYTSNMPVNMVQDLVFKETEDYFMVYDPTDSSFWIAITGQPFATWQSVAEQDFLQTLGVSAMDACKLEVAEGVVYSAGDSNDGKSFPLSFCAAASTSTFAQ